MKNIKNAYQLREIKIEVTHDCLLECAHCSSVSTKRTDRNIDLDTCFRIIKDAHDLGVQEIAFSGGEPLLWPHLTKAVHLCSELGISSLLYTTGNAQGANGHMSDLKNAGLSKVMFSIYDISANSHDRLTGTPGSQATTLDLVGHCVSMGLETEFHFVPFSHNYNRLKSITGMAKQLGISRVSVLRLVPQGRASQQTISPLSRSQNLELRKSIRVLQGRGENIRLGSPYNFLLLKENGHCHAGIDRLTIGPDLRIFPCDAFKHISPHQLGISSVYSNLKEHSMFDCWLQSQYLKAVRHYLASTPGDECLTCKHLARCGSGCVAQKFYAYGKLSKKHDPMCLIYG